MSEFFEDDTDAVADLWQHLESADVVMLGTLSPAGGFRPMRPFASREECAVWFFARQSSTWGEEIGEGEAGHILLVASDAYLDVPGRLETSTSQTHVERYWSGEIATLYPQGRHDADILLLRFTPQTATLWLEGDGPGSLGREIAVAGLIGDLPGTPTEQLAPDG